MPLIESLLGECKRREVAEAHLRLCTLLLMYKSLPGRGAVYLRPTAYRVPVQRLLDDMAGLTGGDKRDLMQKFMKAVGEAVAELKKELGGVASAENLRRALLWRLLEELRKLA
jgi:hypothetical protein